MNRFVRVLWLISEQASPKMNMADLQELERFDDVESVYIPQHGGMY